MDGGMDGWMDDDGVMLGVYVYRFMSVYIGLCLGVYMCVHAFIIQKHAPARLHVHMHNIGLHITHLAIYPSTSGQIDI